MRPKKGRGQLVFINLQKRLLSSVEAFYRTLQAHAERFERGDLGKDSNLDLVEQLTTTPAGEDDDAETVDSDEDQHDREEDAAVRAASTLLQSPQARARELLDEMLMLAKQLRRQPDQKVQRLVQWIQENQCSGAGKTNAAKKELAWNNKRLLIFTEYADTKRYIEAQLGLAIENTMGADQRILGFHGAMSDEQRDQVQRHFNGEPDAFPVRIMVATDAAREGLNLQNHCYNLFHFDIPWNPARMEQRNGRIDRTLQPEKTVYCHYFAYTERQEDAVLSKLVEKVETIQNELGSLGDVVMRRIEGALGKGITLATSAEIDSADPSKEAAAAVQSELEAQRANIKALKEEADAAGKIFNESKKLIDFEPERLRDAVDVGLELARATPLQPVDDEAISGQEVFRLPPLGESWTETLDSLRPPRERDETPWGLA